MIEVVIALGIGYLAYRAFRGGFQRPQSERLTGYGIVGMIIMLLIALLLALKLLEWVFPILF